MRDIKFRAWDKTINYMDYRVRFSHFEDGIEVLDSWSSWRELKKDEYELMQYTGFKDINGVEIYEGDILKWTDFEMNNTTINPVYLEGTTPIFNVYVDELIYATTLLTLNKIKDGYFEVIGNIYENPELLED